MNTLRHTALQRCGALLVLAAVAGGVHGPAAAQTQLADQPVFTNTGVPGNLALALSVEFPTAVSVAHTGNTYSSANTYLGYFDPAKCYLYSHSETEADRHFYPAGAATNRTCTGSQNTKWSGNFLNWATMQTIDPFRWALTGGYRVRDTTTETYIEKAWASGQGGTGNFPNRSLGTAALVQENTPFDAWATMAMRIQGLGNKMRFTVTGGVDNAPTAYNPAVAVDGATVYEVSVRVKVCDSDVAAAGPLESNCTAYPNGSYKPTGLLQQYAERIRYSAFGYLNDSNLQRDGAVLRARQKFVGPTITVPTLPATANAAREWDPETGILNINPDATDASDTATLFGTPVTNSGVINYLNKFGQITPGSYKTYDPVGELYYAAIRYFKNLGNVPEWSAKSGDNNVNRTWVDGFPVITTWDDPLQYSCQKNFVLGIGDVNAHADKNVPGNTGAASEPAKPASVTADTTVDAVLATNKIGELHGLGTTAGTTYPWGGCCNNNSALMAGIAYDANTKDIRPDNPAVPKTKNKQTVQTYWLDILEYQTYKANNQFYLATKYGGFKAPDNFDPYTRATDIPKEWWSTTGEMVGAQDRPDTYFTAARPDQMVAGLTRAFANIAAQLQAFTTSFSTALPQVALAGVGSFSSKYDSGTWTGEIVANTTTFDPNTGAPSQVAVWSFSGKLAAQIAGTGWDTNRNIITWNPSTSTGVPFRSGSISGTQLASLNTVYRDGDDSADYLNYLRGDPTHEVNSTVAGSAKIYRTRSGPVGDIVGSRARPVGPPSAPFSVATNPGYATFKTTWKDRAPMLYVGTNAGVMHAIKASVKESDADRGREVFAYVPSPIFQGANGNPGQTGLQHRGDPDFTHKNLVDGPIGVFDIDLGRTQGGGGAANWRSVLVGALGKGGKAYYAIDVTDPSAFTNEAAAATKVMWEFTDPDLGFTYGEPAAVKTKKYGWVLIFGSGHNNSSGIGYFFIVNPRTGTLLEKISTGEGTPGSPAGLSQVQAFLPDRTDFTAESVYAGDLLGNLWRLDLTPAAGAYAAPTKIAVLTDATGATVPVTSRPLVVIQPKTNRRYVTVGSGKLLANSDVGNTQPQGFYAIIDGTGTVFNTAATLPEGMSFPIRNAGPSNRLLKLTNLTQPIVLDLASQIGWWVDLGTATGGSGWRVITDSTAFLGTVAFAAMVPSGDVCSPSGLNRVFAIDVGSGQSRLMAGESILPFNDSLPGVITDLRFYSVDGKPRLIGGTDTGGTDRFEGNWTQGTGVRRLNWRELPLAD
jgi:type IV pilus assembly protein PilY1